ncbi:MAG TPA: hypothetical protein VFO93_06290 [Hymenobacter sp.]|uniref:hypothetical protein n=1 Tax=Hymenobacter sp. TaxID=1898978 RepID=UPI002D7FDB99|nr:hypothetical protein [Hymenobacter sp.]HET9503129.1 hypothetical protein [Hymenobacter sp.]
MAKNLTYAALIALLYLASSCKKDEPEIYKLTQSCAPTAKTVKTITNATGFVRLDAATQQCVVSVHVPGTVDVVDLGVVCGSLPDAIQKDGAKVTVSGTFKEYGQPAPQPLPAGYTYYYLEVSSIQLQ